MVRPLLPWLAGLALAGGVWGVYWRAAGYDFAGYDDHQQIVKNYVIRALTPANLVRIFTTRNISSYYPVRTLSFAVDYAVWGLDPTGYHLTNVLLHTVNVWLLFWLVLRLVGRRSHLFEPAAGLSSVALGAKEEAAGDEGPGRNTRQPSRIPANPNGAGPRSRLAPFDGAGRGTAWPVVAAALGAGVFALHPVIVEPVAWIGGREELLMVLGTAACLHFHLSARRLEARRRTARAVACHAAAFLSCLAACWSNVVGAVVPALVVASDLLLLPRPGRLRRLATTAPLWAVAVATLIVKRFQPGAELEHQLRIEVPLAMRPAFALKLYATNLRTLLWPRQLTVQYPWDAPEGYLAWGVAAGLLAIAGTAVLLYAARRRRGVVFGLTWFLVGLAPSAQIVTHHLYRADRLLVLPLAGLAVTAGAALAGLRRQAVRGAVAAAAVLILVIWGLLGARQLTFWKDGVTLFARAVRLHPDSAVARMNLGSALAARGRVQEGLDHLARVVAAEPRYFDARNNLANALLESGQVAAAVEQYRAALAINPRFAEARYNLGVALAREGDVEGAIEAYREALAVNPTHVEAHNNLGTLLADRGRPDLAIGHYREALAVDPAFAKAHYNLANALAAEGELERAREQYAQAVALEPKHARAHYGLGNVLLRLGRPEEAVEAYQSALDVDPRYVAAHNNLGTAYASLDRADRAAEHYRAAVAIDPRHAGAHANLATILARQGDDRGAARHWERALEADPGRLGAVRSLAWLLATAPDPEVRDATRAVGLAEALCRRTGFARAAAVHTLAVAYAAAGRFEDAAAAAEKALELARRDGDADLVEDIRRRLQRYRERTP